MPCAIAPFDPARKPGPAAHLAFWLGRGWYRSRWLTRLLPDHPRMLSLLRGAAESNHVAALSLLGHVLALRGVSFGDRSLGFDYLQRAATLGDAAAAVYLARCALQGTAGAPALAPGQLRAWLARAAADGHPLAEGLLAQLRQSAV